MARVVVAEPLCPHYLPVTTANIPCQNDPVGHFEQSGQVRLDQPRAGIGKQTLLERTNNVKFD